VNKVDYGELFPKSVLAFSTLAFIGIGISFIAFPESLLEVVGIHAPAGSPLTDIRAIYGGIDLGVGLFLLYCLVRSEVRLGLIASALILFSLAAGRSVGLVLDGEQDAITFYLLAVEVLGGALSAIAVTRAAKNR